MPIAYGNMGSYIIILKGALCGRLPSRICDGSWVPRDEYRGFGVSVRYGVHQRGRGLIPHRPEIRQEALVAGVVGVHRAHRVKVRRHAWSHRLGSEQDMV